MQVYLLHQNLHRLVCTYVYFCCMMSIIEWSITFRIGQTTDLILCHTHAHEGLWSNKLRHKPHEAIVTRDPSLFCLSSKKIRALGFACRWSVIIRQICPNLLDYQNVAQVKWLHCLCHIFGIKIIFRHRLTINKMPQCQYAQTAFYATCFSLIKILAMKLINISI